MFGFNASCAAQHNADAARRGLPAIIHLRNGLTPGASGAWSTGILHVAANLLMGPLTHGSLAATYIAVLGGWERY